MGLRGYTLPLSSTGRSALVPPPPWHFSGEVLIVEYVVDPERMREFMPAGVEADDEGRAAAIFGSWQSCSDGGAELLDPVRSQYKEFYVALRCRVAGRTMVRCAFCWVDKDFSLVRGLVQGYPKKLGSVWMTRTFSVGRAAPPLARGSRFAATLAANDRRLVELEVALERPGDIAPEMMTAPLVHTRLFPAWASEGASVDELVTGGSRDQETSEIWQGSGQVSFSSAPGEELDALQPDRVLGGWRLLFAETLDGGELVLSGT
jgi:acetoacetate decarboxylase